jgi:hypothetical protein
MDTRNRATETLVHNFTSYHQKSDFVGLLGTTIEAVREMRVTHLGIWKLSGGAAFSTLMLATEADRLPIPGTRVTVDLSDAEDEAFHYAELEAPVTLRAGVRYMLLMEKTEAPDLWHHEYTALETSGAARVLGGVWKHPVTGKWKQHYFDQTGFGPINMKFEFEGERPPLVASPMDRADPVDFAPRANFGRRLEPADTVLHGAGQSPEAFEKYVELMPATPPAVYMIYMGLQNYSEGRLKERTEAYDSKDFAPIPQLGLGMTVDGRPERHYEQMIASGELDASVDQFVEDLKAYGKPIYIRLGYEFNGPWNGYEPETYREAWKRIVGKVRAAGIENAAFIWCISGDGDFEGDLMEYYPGDEWVDWWSVDLFATQHMHHPKLVEFVEEAGRRKFPVMIGESTARYIGTIHGEASWRLFYLPYFNFIRRYPHVKSFCYINWNWDDTQWDWGECRLEIAPEVADKYKAEMTEPFYQHGVSD